VSYAAHRVFHLCDAIRENRDMTAARRLQGRELRLHSIHPHRGWVHEKDVIEMARHQHRSARNQLRGGGSVQEPAVPLDADSGIAAAGL
jgi:hypothetical protein